MNKLNKENFANLTHEQKLEFFRERQKKISEKFKSNENQEDSEE
jgi:hypothetical protein